MSQNDRTEKDFWIEMSIREIWTQAHFAQISFQNLQAKSRFSTDAVFSSIHSFLSHCAIVSKLLKASAEGTSIGNVLGIDDASTIHNRTFRNHLEHYDDRLKKWIRDTGLGSAIGAYNVGPKTAIGGTNIVFVSHYDPTTTTFTFIDEDLNLAPLYSEVQRIGQVADAWVQDVQSRAKEPPFG